MPGTCSSLPSGVVVHENRIKVITENGCMYPDDTDTWTVKQYSRLCNKLLEVDGYVQQGKASIHMVHVLRLIIMWVTCGKLSIRRLTMYGAP